MKKNRFKLTLSNWADGIWGNRTLYFKSLKEAKERAKKENGKIKVYDDEGKLIHSENNNNVDSYA